MWSGAALVSRSMGGPEKARQRDRIPLPCFLMEQVFASGMRTDATPMRFNESIYSFLDRSADPRAGNYRQLVGSWVTQVPDGGADLAGRIASGKDDQFEAAIWELLLYQAYTSSGYSVELHPSIESASTRPDFLVQGHGSRFYLEAVRASDAALAAREAKLVGEVHQVLSLLPADRFTVDMTDFGVGVRPLATGPLKKQLIDWVATLDYARAVLEWNAGHRGPAARWTWRHEDWLLSFQAHPVPESALGRSRRMVRAFGGGGFVDDAARIALALKSKSSRYGIPDAPLVIAVLCNTSPGVVDSDDLEEALYGALIGRHAWGDEPPPARSVHRPGLWSSPSGEFAHSHIPQVISAQNVPFLGIPVCRPRLWTTLEPGVSQPVQPAWLARVTMTPSGPRTASATSTAATLGLPEDWPVRP